MMTRDKDVTGNVADVARLHGYSGDMAIAADAFDALFANRLAFLWQPVVDARSPERVLYHECLLRLVASDGSLEAPGKQIEALERLGMMRALDKYVVGQVVNELRSAPAARLAANISAQSAVCDEWWVEIAESLKRQPGVASRLTIEITESSSLPSIEKSTAFVDWLRGLGCKVALDDFGVGHATIRAFLALKPDVVKIDAFFVARARNGRNERLFLQHMVGLAASAAAAVVVEGVETNDDMMVVLEAGAHWQQGWFCGSPSASRPWRLGPAAVLDHS